MTTVYVFWAPVQRCSLQRVELQTPSKGSRRLLLTLTYRRCVLAVGLLTVRNEKPRCRIWKSASSHPICDNELVCNRYRLTHSKQYLAERFHAADAEIEEHPRFNIAPTQPVLIVRKEQGKKIRRFTTMRWGLIPSWAKDMSIGNRTLNARSETVTTTPAFRDPILTRRCLIPADGFYEWALLIMNDSRHYSVSRTIAE